MVMLQSAFKIIVVHKFHLEIFGLENYKNSFLNLYMLQSMTGFGSASFKIDELEIEIEIKTLNSKYLDSKVLLPNVISGYELELNKLLKDNLIRGKVDLRIKFSDIANESVKFNKEVISKYINELKGVSDFDESQLLKNVLSLPNSITKEENIIEDNLKTRIFECVNKVIDQVIKFREIEASNIKNDLFDNLDKLDSFKVNSLDRFLANVSILSLPCFPVKVLAFFVLTNKPLIIFLCELLFQVIYSEVILLVVVKVA